MICGFLVRLILLPDWVRPISWRWRDLGYARDSRVVDGGTPLPDVAMCLALGAIYIGIGVVLTETVLRAARSKASLSLT